MIQASDRPVDVVAAASEAAARLDDPRVLVYHPTRAAEYAVLLRRRLPELAIEVAASPEQLRQRLPPAEVLVASGAVPFPADVWATARRLRWIQLTSAGVDGILSAAIPPGVRVTRLTGSFGRQMGEYVLAYLLTVRQGIRRTDAQQRDRAWRPFVPELLGEALIGVAGTGAIGGAIGRLLAAVGCRVWGLARRPRPIDGFERVVGPADLGTLLAAVDALVLGLPLTSETRRVIGGRELALMKPNALLVNVSRGGLVDQEALVAALAAGRLGGAVLDVFEVEPLPVDSPLWTMRNVWITPHLAGTSEPAEFVAAFATNLDRFRAGETLAHEVDREAGY